MWKKIILGIIYATVTAMFLTVMVYNICTVGFSFIAIAELILAAWFCLMSLKQFADMMESVVNLLENISSYPRINVCIVIVALVILAEQINTTPGVKDFLINLFRFKFY